MDTRWQNWALTLGTTLVIAAITAGHGAIVMRAAGRVIDFAWMLVQPLGPA